MSRNNANPMKSTEGIWNKIARKTYRHISGATITYDGNAWAWRIEGVARTFSTLGYAMYEVERTAVAS
jgi:hypothetical protein